MRSALALTMLLVPLAACTLLRSGEPVGPDEVQKELVGKVWRVKLPNGQPAIEHFNADGTVHITGGLNDNGKWWLWNYGYCTSWEHIRNGQERCFTLDKTKDGIYHIYKPGGDISMTIVGFE